MRILVVDDDSDIREIIEFTFECEVKAEYVHRETGNEAIDLLKKDPAFDLIVCDYNMPNGSGGEVYKFMMQNDMKIPYALCSSEIAGDHHEFDDKRLFIGQITKPFIFDGVQKILENITSFDSGVAMKKPEKNFSEYLPISVEVLAKRSHLSTDLYLKLDNDKILQVMSTGDEYSSEEVDKYHSKGIESLLIKREDTQRFVDSICNTIQELLTDEKKEDVLKVLDAHSVIASTVKHLGVSEKVIKAANRSVNYAVTVLQKSPEFKMLEKHLFGHPGKYLTTHSIALAFVSVGILLKTKWDTPDIRKRLVVASFMHDVSILDPEFSEAEIGEKMNLYNFKDHPREALDVIRKIKNIPEDLENIILEHHERPDGSGFPRGLNGSQLKPLSSLFIFSHDVVDIIIDCVNTGKVISDRLILDSLDHDLYNVGHFKKCLGALKEAKIFE